jgi:aminopeptidase N
VYDVDGDALTLRATHDLEPTGPVRIDDVPADALVLLNAGDHTFAGARPDDRSLEVLTRHAGSLPRAVDRALAVTTVWGLMYRGLIGAEPLVTTAVAVLRSETAASVVEPVFHLAAGAAEQWASPADRGRLTCLLADTTVALLDHPDHRPTAIRGLATVATTHDQLAVLDRLAADHPGDTTLQWARLAGLARLGRLDLDEVDALQQRDQDPEAWRNALVARVARPDAAAKREGWDALFADAARLGFTGMRGLSRAIWVAGHDPVLGELTEEFVARLPDLTRLGSKLAGYLTACLFPVVAVDEAYLHRVLAAAERPDVLDVVRNRVRERADVVRRMLAARSLG